MNIYIMVDAEGISGICDREQVMPSGSRYQEGRELMGKDINACVEGLKVAGADKIYVRDCHSGGTNVVWSALSGLADYYIVGYPGAGGLRRRHFAWISCHGRHSGRYSGAHDEFGHRAELLDQRQKSG